jgi:hypothetical protein
MSMEAANHEVYQLLKGGKKAFQFPWWIRGIRHLSPVEAENLRDSKLTKLEALSVDFDVAVTVSAL